MEAINAGRRETPVKLDRYGRKEVSRGVVRVLILGIVLFSTSGTFYWPAAWVYILVCFCFICFNMLVLVRINPEVLNVRGRKPKEMPRFDKIILPLWMISQLTGLVLAGLDYGRFHWSSVPLAVQAAGVVGLAGGGALIVWSMSVNAHFETTVRIQSDRDHQVCSSGPYRFVRHPGYAGIILASFGSPLLLGSWPALITGFVSAALFVCRTWIEDRILMAELAGYAEFASKTRRRLAPGIW